jgi:hypothetical protein
MQSFIHADIFFFVTTVVVALVGIGFLVIVLYLIRIVRTVQKIMRAIRDESEAVVADVSELRAHLRKGGSRMLHILQMLRLAGVIEKERKNKKKSAHKESPS